MEIRLNERSESLIKRVVKRNKSVDKRCMELINYGFVVRRCYVPTYNKLLGKSYVKDEVRIIVGRPNNHFCREVYAVIIKV